MSETCSSCGDEISTGVPVDPDHTYHVGCYEDERGRRLCFIPDYVPRHPLS